MRPLIVVLLAITVCAAFGALHNQFSYTVSPDYFHAFKFYQFEVAEPLRNRWGASLVGVGASWWMGVPLGVILGAPTLLQPTRRGFARATLLSIVTMLAVTMASGALGLALASTAVEAPARLEIYEGVPVQDPAAFWRAGAMHNFSYLGAAVGLLPALFMQGLVYRSEVRRARSTSL
ncbi:MAG TPA: hypothetical protein VGN57_09700 [Pirellulaceae bacterium]|nr:hypothetical protein [Pirellulaceae bacterium]